MITDIHKHIILAERHIDGIEIGIHRGYRDDLLKALRSDPSVFTPRKPYVPSKPKYHPKKEPYKVRVYPFEVVGAKKEPPANEVKLTQPINESYFADKSFRLVTLEFNGRLPQPIRAVQDLLANVLGSQIEKHCFIQTFEVCWNFFVKLPGEIEEVRKWFTDGLTIKNCPGQLHRRVKETTYYGHKGFKDWGSKGIKIYPRSDYGPAKDQKPPYDFLRFEMVFNRDYFKKRDIPISSVHKLDSKLDPLSHVQYRNLKPDITWEQIHSDILDHLLNRHNKPLSAAQKQTLDALIKSRTREILMLDLNKQISGDLPTANLFTAYRSLVIHYKIKPERGKYYFPYDEDKIQTIAELPKKRV